MKHKENHKSHRTGWLRAAVLGANDGIVSTASLIIGIASAGSSQYEILLAGIAGLVAGAMSMAAGEFVSVSSQADTEQADLEIEQESLAHNYDAEIEELAEIYRNRGIEDDLATTVAQQLMEYDALGAHARDEIGIAIVPAQPIQAAVFSATTFTLGAGLPLLTATVVKVDWIIVSVACLSLIFLAGLGGLSAYIGGANKWRAAIRVAIWGGLAMLVTAAVGHLFGIAVT